uniref:F-box domain-containing protein n=1 Tax=Timema poppense TaxID=170557 RepID=A0A7R9HCH6_TIMPO|nr:unnamed protein product [Timema poppensis]
MTSGRGCGERDDVTEENSGRLGCMTSPGIKREREGSSGPTTLKAKVFSVNVTLEAVYSREPRLRQRNILLPFGSNWAYSVRARRWPDHSRTPSMDVLPNEILLLIFSHLGVEDIVTRAQHVCKRWRLLCARSGMWKDLVYVPGKRVSEKEVYEVIRQAPKLRRVCLDRSMDTDTFIDNVRRFCQDIRELRVTPISWCGLSSRHIRAIVTRYPDIETLGVSLGEESPRESLQLIGSLGNLRSLELFGFNSEDWVGEWRVLADGCPSLERLDFSCYGLKVTPEDLAYFLSRKKDWLRYLRVTCPRLDRETVKLLGQCTTLEELRVVHMPQDTPVDLRPLVRLPRLKSLGLRYHQEDGQALSDMFLCGDWSHLRDLHLTFSHRMSDLKVIFRRCPLLERLDLCEMKRSTGGPTDQDLEELHRMVRLRYLRLTGLRRITDLAAEHIGRCADLREIIIVGCVHITDGAMGGLVRCSMLTHLSLPLDDCFVTGSGFHLFPTHLKGLRHLTVTDSIAKDVLGDLARRMPSLEITVNQSPVF